VKGRCPVDCPYCYVKIFRRRFGGHDDIRFYPGELEDMKRRKKPSRVFVGSMIELFHDQTIQYMPELLDTVRLCPQHTFMFLTKQPQNLTKFSPFPPNAWVGVTATNQIKFDEAAMWYLPGIKASIKYVSIEPLLDRILVSGQTLRVCGINWVIIGAQSYPTVMPEISWVKDIIEACDKAGVRVLLKNSLRPLFPNQKLRQEMPR